MPRGSSNMTTAAVRDTMSTPITDFLHLLVVSDPAIQQTAACGGWDVGAKIAAVARVFSALDMWTVGVLRLVSPAMWQRLEDRAEAGEFSYVLLIALKREYERLAQLCASDSAHETHPPTPSPTAVPQLQVRNAATNMVPNNQPPGRTGNSRQSASEHSRAFPRVDVRRETTENTPTPPQEPALNSVTRSSHAPTSRFIKKEPNSDHVKNRPTYRTGTSRIPGAHNQSERLNFSTAEGNNVTRAHGWRKRAFEDGPTSPSQQDGGAIIITNDVPEELRLPKRRRKHVRKELENEWESESETRAVGGGGGLERLDSERPYTCTYDGCSARFTTKANRRRHERGIHSYTREKLRQFVDGCADCNTAFTDESSRRLHMMLHEQNFLAPAYTDESESDSTKHR